MTIPTPPDLGHAPELAVLTVLETCIETATHAVIAEQPALRSGDPDNNPPRDCHWAALALLHASDDLLRALRAYREALDRERDRERAKQEDLPF